MCEKYSKKNESPFYFFTSKAKAIKNFQVKNEGGWGK